MELNQAVRTPNSVVHCACVLACVTLRGDMLEVVTLQRRSGKKGRWALYTNDRPLRPGDHAAGHATRFLRFCVSQPPQQRQGEGGESR